MSALSASKMKQGGLTTLELQAHNMAREDDDSDVEVTDEAKYNALLELRKNRRAVSVLVIISIDLAIANFDAFEFEIVGRESI